MRLRREERQRRLDLRDLPPTTRRLARLALSVIGVWAVIIIAQAVGWGIPGPTFEISSPFLSGGVATVPVLVLLVTCAGMCVAIAALALAKRQSDRRWSRVTLVGIGILGLALSSQVVGAGGILGALERVLAGAGHLIPSPAASLVIEAGGWLGLVCAAIAIGLALIPARFVNPWLLTTVAIVPFVLTTILIMVVDYEPSARSTVASTLGILALPAAFWLAPLGLWQAAAWARASRREIGGAIAAREARWPWLLVALLTLKLGWLGFGYAGRLPSLLGGRSDVWTIGNSIPAWLIAGGFVGFIGWWLASRHRFVVSERGFRPAAILVVVGFSAVTVVMSLALLGFDMAGLLPGTLTTDLVTGCASTWPSEAIGNAIRCLLIGVTDRADELSLLVPLGTLVVALVTAAWLWRRPGWRSSALFLAVVVAWVAPHVPQVVGDLLGFPPGPSIAPSLAAFDTALTITIAALALAWYKGWQRGAGPRALLLVLVVSTLLAHAGTVVPESSTTMFFFLALLFPIAYEIFFDPPAGDHRRAGRPAQILESLGLRISLLSIITFGIALGTIGPTVFDEGQLGRVLFAVPFSMLLVAATLSRQHVVIGAAATAEAALEPATVAPASSETQAAPPPEPEPAIVSGVQPRVLVRGVVVAALVLAAFVAFGGAVDTVAPLAVPSASPTPTSSAVSIDFTSSAADILVHYSDFTCAVPTASGSVGYNETDCIQAQANGLMYKIVLYTDATTGKLAAGFAWVIDPKGQALAPSDAFDHLGTFVTTLLGANAPPVATWLSANLGHELARQKLSSNLTAFTGSAANESQLYISLDSAAFLAAPSASPVPASTPIPIGFASTAADILAHYPDFTCVAPMASDSVGYNQTECTQKQVNGFLYGFVLFTDQTTGELAGGGAAVYGSSGKDLAPDDAAAHLDAFVTILLGANASPVVTWLGVNLGHSQESLAISSDLIVVTDIGPDNDKSQLLVGIYSAAFLVAPIATPVPTAAPIDFASTATDILAHYSGFTCNAPVPSIRLGYNETACSQPQANGLVYWIVISTDDTTGELVTGGAWVYGPSGKELSPTDALDHLDAFVTAILGDNASPVIVWLGTHLGNGQPLAISSLLTVNTGTGDNNDKSQLYVGIYSATYLAAPQRSPTP